MPAKVSIIVPVCNSSEYLEECLDSILAQTLNDIEVICVNDGSTDESPSILDLYSSKDERVVVISQDNSGYGKAMNVGIDAANGDWVGFVESDDYIMPDMYRSLVDVAEKWNLDFVKSNLCRFYGEGEGRFFQTSPITRRSELIGKVLNPSKDPSLLDAVMNNVTGVYKKDFLRKNDIRFNETPGASFQDNGFWFQVFTSAERIMFVDETFYMVRRDNPNSSVKSKGKVFCMRDEYSFILSLLERDPRVFHLFVFQWCKKLFSNYIGTLNRVDPSLRADLLSVMSEDYKEYFRREWVDLRLFNPWERETLQRIIDDPIGYADAFPDIRISEVRKTIEKNKLAIAKESRRLSSLKRSYSLRLGEFLTRKRLDCSYSTEDKTIARGDELCSR